MNSVPPKPKQNHADSVCEHLSTPVAEHAKVVVCGGGPAGISAAIAAARTQKFLGLPPDVRLIETHGQLGGVWTSGLLCWILDAENKLGLMREIRTSLEAYRLSHDGRPTTRPGQLYDVEHMLEQMCLQAGVRVRLHTRVVAAHRQQGALKHIVTESKSGRQAFAAECFVDCTGDGDLAAQAGCAYNMGRAEPGGDMKYACQPMTLMAMVTGIDRIKAARFYDRHRFNSLDLKQALLAEFQRAGVTPSYTHPTLFEVYPDLYAIMANHEYGYDSLDAQQITDATLAARQEINTLIDALRSLGGAWQNLRLVTTAAQIGIRESRRPKGLYEISLEDIAKGRRHPDAVCECRFNIDVHATSPTEGSNLEQIPITRTLPYDIPYRALVTRDVSHLLLAGRCISGDFYAHSSYRVTGNAVPMGEAAGCAAAIAAYKRCPPHCLDYVNDVQPVLKQLSDQYAHKSSAKPTTVVV